MYVVSNSMDSASDILVFVTMHINRLVYWKNNKNKTFLQPRNTLSPVFFLLTLHTTDGTKLWHPTSYFLTWSPWKPWVDSWISSNACLPTSPITIKRKNYFIEKFYLLLQVIWNFIQLYRDKFTITPSPPPLPKKKQWKKPGFVSHFGQKMKRIP